MDQVYKQRMPRSRSRSRSPGHKRDRRRSRSRERDRRRHGKKRSRSRSPRHSRRRSKSPSPRRRSFSPRRSRSRERSTSQDASTAPVIDESKLEGLDEEQIDMMKLMGFAGFDTTKGKKVEGNNVSAVNIQRKRRYRQYMNRKGGFNRPLDFIA